MADQGENKPDFSGLKQYSSSVGLGCLPPLMIVGAIFLGRWLDRLLGTTPWILLSLILISMPLSIYMIIRVAKQSTENN